MAMCNMKERGMDIGMWIGSHERHSSKGHRKLCNTPRPLIATLQSCISWGQTESKENIAIKSSNTLAKTIKQVDSREEKQMQVLVIPLYFYFTVLLASTATSPEMVD